MYHYIYKYNEIYSHFEDFIKIQLEYNKDYLNETDFSDIHDQAFNQGYYIIGRYKATKWLADEVFNVINIIKEYDKNECADHIIKKIRENNIDILKVSDDVLFITWINLVN